MKICSATKANGDPCTLPANESQGVCWAHSPQNRERRRRNASKAARAKGGGKEVRELKGELREVIKRVEKGEVSATRGNTMLRGYGVLLDYIKLERGILVEDELAAVLEELKHGERPHPA